MYSVQGIFQHYSQCTTVRTILSKIQYVQDFSKIEQHILDTNAGKNCLKLPQLSIKHWCWKNEQHLNIY